MRLGRGERQSNAKQYEIKPTNREKKTFNFNLFLLLIIKNLFFQMTALEQQNIIVSIPAGAHAEVHVRSYGNVTPVRREEAPQAPPRPPTQEDRRSPRERAGRREVGENKKGWAPRPRSEGEEYIGKIVVVANRNVCPCQWQRQLSRNNKLRYRVADKSFSKRTNRCPHLKDTVFRVDCCCVKQLTNGQWQYCDYYTGNGRLKDIRGTFVKHMKRAHPHIELPDGRFRG